VRIRVETSSGMPITRQIAAQIRAGCASGVLRPGDRLPSVRALAAELAVNQNTVLRVYERLTAEGLLDRRHGDGTFVADRVPTGQMKAQRQLLRQQIARAAELAKTLGVDAVEVHRLFEEALDQLGNRQTP
jgi:GntR family transcriptional regulator